MANSIRLLEDAKLLYKNRKYLSAIILALYSLEECGKGVILLDRLKKDVDVGKRSWGILFKDHETKLRDAPRFGKLIGVKPKG